MLTICSGPVSCFYYNPGHYLRAALQTNSGNDDAPDWFDLADFFFSSTGLGASRLSRARECHGLGMYCYAVGCHMGQGGRMGWPMAQYTDLQLLHKEASERKEASKTNWL